MKTKTLEASAHKQVRVFGGLPMLITAVVIVALLVILPLTGVLSSNTQRYLLKIFLYCCLGSMWNLMSGYTGMTSLGQQSFIGIAGYSLAVMTFTYGASYWAGFAVGGVLGAALALGLSVLLFRMRGMYFAIATWVVAEALKTFFTSWTFVKQGAGHDDQGQALSQHDRDLYDRSGAVRRLPGGHLPAAALQDRPGPHRHAGRRGRGLPAWV